MLELQTLDDHRVVAKAHRRAERYAVERDAHRRWVPALGDAAPRLLAADDARHALLLSFVDGRALEPADLDDADVWADAGRLLRRFHDAAPPVGLPPFAGPQLERLDRWAARARPGLLVTAHVDFVRERLAALDGTPAVGSPSHRDYTPRNWLRDRFGRLAVIDFEHAAVEPWVADLRRLWWAEWDGHPERASAFLSGYGRELIDADRAVLAALSALEHLTSIVWADEHADAPFEAAARAALTRAMAGDQPPWPVAAAPVGTAPLGAAPLGPRPKAEARFTVVDLLAEARRGLDRLGPGAARAALLDGAVLLDTRQERDRRRDGAVPGSYPVPRTVLEWAVDPASGQPNAAIAAARRLIVMCNEGYSSSLAAANLRRLGFDATDLVGGFRAWKAAGLPVRPATAAPADVLDGRGPPEPGDP